MGNYTIEVNDQNFDEKVLKSKIPVLVDFWAPWCGPCISIAPALESLAQEFEGKAAIAKMNVDENRDIPVQYGVRSIPYLVCFKDGKIVASEVGAVAKTKIAAVINKALS